MGAEEQRVPPGERHVTVQSLDEIIVQPVIAPVEDGHERLPLPEHVMHRVVLVAFREHGPVRRHPVELFTDQAHDRDASLLPPSSVLRLRPPIHADPVLAIKVVDVVDQPDDQHGVGVVPAVEEFPFHVLEAPEPVVPTLGRLVHAQGIRLEGALVALDEVEEYLGSP